jgi:hypothetical protein
MSAVSVGGGEAARFARRCDDGGSETDSGWAVVTGATRGRYEAEEAAARAERLGIWSGRFTLPEDYRRRP